jgi:putative endonuclease
MLHELTLVQDDMFTGMGFYYVYILSSQTRVLYIGVTSNLEQRVFQHKQHTFGAFTAKYNVTSLAYFERFATIHAAIAREKELKGWVRSKKVQLIESLNPKWKDLSYGWYQKHRYAPEKKIS